MSAGPGPLPRADAYGYAQARRSRSVLVLSLGLHLLAAWLWLQQRPARPPRAADTPGMVTILLRPLDAARTPASSPAPNYPRATPAASPGGERAPAARQPGLAPVFVPPPEPVSASPSGAAPAAPAAPAAAVAPAGFQASTSDAASAPGAGDSTSSAAPATADGGFTAGLGRRQAGRVDRELRGGKSGVPTEADTPWARFQRGLDAAHVESSLSAHLDSYTSPDGVVIYRRRVGSRTSCYQTGSVGLGVAGTRTGGNAGNVACPSGVTWTREE